MRHGTTLPRSSGSTSMYFWHFEFGHRTAETTGHLANAHPSRRGDLTLLFLLLVRIDVLLRVFVELVAAAAAADVVGLAHVRNGDRTEAAGDDAFVLLPAA